MEYGPALGLPEEIPMAIHLQTKTRADSWWGDSDAKAAGAIEKTVQGDPGAKTNVAGQVAGGPRGDYVRLDGFRSRQAPDGTKVLALLDFLTKPVTDEQLRAADLSPAAAEQVREGATRLRAASDELFAAMRAGTEPSPDAVARFDAAIADVLQPFGPVASVVAGAVSETMRNLLEDAAFIREQQALIRNIR